MELLITVLIKDQNGPKLSAQQDPACSLHDPNKHQAWIPVCLSLNWSSDHYNAGPYGRGFVLHLARIAKYLLKQGIECVSLTLQINSLAFRIQIQSNSLLLELVSFVISRHSGRQCECAQYFDIYCIGKLYTNAHLSQQRLRRYVKALKNYLPPHRWVTDYCHIKHSFSGRPWMRQWWMQTHSKETQPDTNPVPSCNHSSFSFYIDSVAHNRMIVYVDKKAHKAQSIEKLKSHETWTSQT